MSSFKYLPTAHRVLYLQAPINHFHFTTTHDSHVLFPASPLPSHLRLQQPFARPTNSPHCHQDSDHLPPPTHPSDTLAFPPTMSALPLYIPSSTSPTSDAYNLRLPRVPSSPPQTRLPTPRSVELAFLLRPSFLH